MKRRRAPKRRKPRARARARARRRHHWTRTVTGARMKSGVFLARLWKRRGRVLFQVTATGYQRSGIAQTMAIAKRKAASAIAHGHRALAADVMRTVR